MTQPTFRPAFDGTLVIERRGHDRITLLPSPPTDVQDAPRRTPVWQVFNGSVPVGVVERIEHESFADIWMRVAKAMNHLP